MTARDTIAAAIRGGSQADMDWLYYADAVITAVRGMPVEEQAELIGAWVASGTGVPSGYWALAVKR